MEAKIKKLDRKPTKIEEMTKEQIRQAIIKKRECNARAQNIVENLIEKDIKEDYLLKCLPDINQAHFDDVIEERSILHLCGYPICQKALSEQDIPKQKYRISMKTNKVYDITARKSFCSNICYKSAMHIKKQMLTSPLWFREYEVIPEFHLLPINSIGSMGQEVDLSLTERINLITEGHKFISINDFTNATLDKIDILQDHNESCNKNTKPREDMNDCKQSRPIGIAKETKVNNKILVDERCTNIINTQPISKKRVDTTEHLSLKKSTQNPLNIVGEVIEKPIKPIDPILTNLPTNLTTEDVNNINNNTQKKLPQKKQHTLTTITIEVEKCLAEWFTIDTLLFLFGEVKVKEMVTDKGDCIQEYLNNYSKHIAYSSNTYDQYQALCRKLNMLELEDRRYHSKTLAKETKPLPDYSILKEESKKMQLKIKAFFSGETETTAIPDDQPEVPTDEENKTHLPLVDKNAQHALRRRIVCNNLNKVLPDLLRSLGLLTSTISSDIRLLVNTFKLKANNITFKPLQWTLIAIVFIKLLSVRDGRLEYLLEQPMAFQHMQLLLLSYKQDGGYLDRLISWLTDIDRLLDINDNQLTIE